MTGEGLHQIPVGPVHAGIIEPGHFRFTANGETVARLEERLGYVHKGIDGLLDRRRDRAGGARRRARLRRFHRGLQLRLRARGRGGARHRAAAARAGAARRHGRARAHRQPFRRHRRDLQRRRLRAHPRPLRHLPRARAGGGGPRVRPSPDDGPHRAGRRRATTSPRRRARDPRACSTRSSRRSPRSCGSTTTRRRCRIAPAPPASSARDLVRAGRAGGHVGRASGRDFDARRDLAYAPYDGRALRGAGAHRGRRRCARLGAHPRDRAEHPRCCKAWLADLPAGPTRDRRCRRRRARARASP